MNAQDRPAQSPQHTSRTVYLVLLVIAVLLLLAYSARFAFPSGIGIEREPAERAPAESPQR